MAALLGDTDADVRMLATELARNMPPADATHVLCGLLEKEHHPNVCAAAVEVLAEVGTRDAFPAFRRAPTICGTPIPAVRHIGRHRPDFSDGRLIGWHAPEVQGLVPSTHAGGRATPLRISLSPDRHVV